MTPPVSAQLELPFAPLSTNPVVTFSTVLGGAAVDYILHRSTGRRRISISIDERGLRVGAPLRASLREIELVLVQHATWVMRKLDEWRAKRPASRRWEAGENISYLGLPLTVAVVAGNSAVTRGEQGVTIHTGDQTPAAIAALAKRWLREEAAAHLQKRVEYFRSHFTLEPVALRLSNARSRWGSCHVSGRISLNWRLIHLPPHLVDYVVVHELAHLREMNHSPRFWAVVGRIIPDYLARRREIRRESHKYLVD